ncbi:hypothetical protein [Rubellimicrobium aerolatum]|uniref:Uncharacterized protein n=1 Tax=Rubellimicrobium aerolatum TaxID=490979 RepID=A0ABW0SE35_9RHOB|nr:hypothetical protein [Rubellimicrobium aerolatum]MBP1807005.1 hypothetical protein [Rubellimicrobium aerolatum]
MPRRDWLGRVRGRTFAVSDPEWDRRVPCEDLVPQFRRALVRDVLEPVREHGLQV